MSIWLYINIVFVLTVIYSVFLTPGSIGLHIYLGFIGLLLIMYNWTRHAFFSTIRQTTSRKKKIRLATISKKVMPIHRWTGSTALLLIISHAWIIISRYGYIAGSMKMWSGVIAAIVLTVMVLTGWLRLYLPSGNKRKAHLWTGFVLFFMIIIHILIF